MSWIQRAAAAPLLLLFAGCSGVQSMLDPAGYTATRVAELWWFMFALGTAVWLIVLALVVYTLFIRRNPENERPISFRTEGVAGKVRWIVGGVAATVLILLAVFIYSLVVSRSIHGLARSEAI